MTDLTIAPANGDQGTTQNPQTAPSAQSVGGASAQSGGVQPGTAQSVLTSQNGLSLHTSALTAVSLNATTTQSSSATSPSVQQPKHHINPIIFGISIVLILIAAGLFWAITRSAKNTTD